MGDNITDLSEKLDVPPVPLKTYQWEDIRRQKLEGRYPWTHLYKPQFDKEKQVESKEHEYEPVIPMNATKNTSPLPTLKITADKEVCTNAEPESPDMAAQDKRHLCIPDNDDSDDSDEDDSDEITAEELQQRLEERYFKDSKFICTTTTTTAAEEGECELSETRSVSPTVSSRSHSKSDSSLSFHDRMQTRAVKLKRRLKNFKDHISKERRPVEGTPRMKRKMCDSRKKAKPAKKNKFNFRKRNVKSQEAPSSSESEIRLPSVGRRRFSLPRLPSFSRSRSNSVKEGECKRSRSSDAESRKFFSYPRMFNSCRSTKKKLEEDPKLADKAKARSAPSTPSTRRRQSPFPQRWVSKFIDHKKEEKPPTSSKATKKESNVKVKGRVVAESIFISLHEDSATNTRKQDNNNRIIDKEKQRVEQEQVNIEEEEAAAAAAATAAAAAAAVPAKIKIDDKNFIFISLHEERFPEKLKQLEEEKQEKEILEEEQEIEKELQQARTARKFHIMLKQMQRSDCKGRRMCRGAAETADDEPEPVLITEVTDDCVDQSNTNLSDNTEQPGIELFIGDDLPPKPKNGKCKNVDKREYQRESHLQATTSYPPSSDELSNNALTRRPVEVERYVDVCEALTDVNPQKTPRRKVRNTDLTEDNLSMRDNRGVGAWPDVTTKTYIKADLERMGMVAAKVECDHAIRHFMEYEKALEKSRSQSSFEIENNYYSNTNSLARMEAPVPPARPSRMGTLARQRILEKILSPVEHKENYYDLDAANTNYHTFPVIKPEKPRRKFRKTSRAYASSTTTTEMRNNMDELGDETINSNIVHSKQLSVSFLPLSSNIVGEPIIDYNLRETSSMINLNLSADPPLPPKRRKSRSQNGPHAKFSSLPNQRFYSKGSLTPSENVNSLGYQIDSRIEYADDASSIEPTPMSPKRPYRRCNTWLPDGDDGLWREIESLSSENKSLRNRDASCCGDTDSRTINEYAIIEAPKSRRESKIDSTAVSMPRRISRQVSDFFTIPRLRPPTNYVPPCSRTLDSRRFPSPSRPPRRNRNQQSDCEHVYTNDEPKCTNNSNQEEQLDFRLATESDTEDVKEDLKNLETHDIFERMKSRPLPPPPRPTRKPREDHKAAEYSRCVKKNPSSVNKTNREDNLGGNIETETVDEDGNISHTATSRSVWNSWERKTTVRKFEISPNGERQEISTPVTSVLLSERGHMVVRDRSSPPTDRATLSDSHGRESSLRCNHNDELVRQSFSDPLSTLTSQSKEICSARRNGDVPAQDPVCVITAAKLNVSELNVGRMNVSEIDSSRLVASNIESSSIQQLDDVRTETGHIIVNAVNYSDCMSAPEQCQVLDVTLAREITPVSNEDIESAETASVRSRISSMVPEIGSEDECGDAGSVKVRRPNRRKHNQAQKREEVQQASQVPAERNHATLAELMGQILRICYSSVGEALNSLFESVIPEDREKRNEVQAAIWVITIIVAGCLMLGLQSSEKVVHHHHWDFHFPPPH